MSKILLSIIMMVGITCCSDVLLWVDDVRDTDQRSCIGLTKVIDLDDVLLQIYRNLDSHCLFTMTGSELQNLWGIAVFEYTDDMSDAEIASVHQARKMHRQTNPNSVAMVKFQHSATIEVLNNQTVNGDVKGMSNKKFPLLLPPPKQLYSVASDQSPPIITGTIEDQQAMPTLPISVHSHYTEWTDYVWLNSKRSKHRPLLVISTADYPLPDRIVVYKNAHNLSKHQPLINSIFH